MAQYQTTTGAGAQTHKPGMADKVKAKAEGLVGKVTGHSSTPTQTGTGTHMGGAAGHTQQQPGYGQQQNMGTEAGYGQTGHHNQQHTGHHNQGYADQPMGANTIGGQLQQPMDGNAYGGQQQQHHTGHHTGYGGQEQLPMGTNTTTGSAQPHNPSMMDKVKGVISPGHQTDTAHASHGAGTHGSSAPAGATGVSTTDKIKNMLPGQHHKVNTGAGTGYN